MAKDGQSYNKLVDKGREWTKKKIEEGWRHTCMGLLSPEDIKEAGFVFDNRLEEVYDYEKGKMVQRAMGYHQIPSQEYMREDSRFGVKGEKYMGPSRKFLNWYEKRRKRQEEYIDQNEEHIEKEINKSSPTDDLINTFGGELM